MKAGVRRVPRPLRAARVRASATAWRCADSCACASEELRELLVESRVFQTTGTERERLTHSLEEGRKIRTVQTFHQGPFLSVERRDSHVGGWRDAFDKLAVYAAGFAKEHAA